LVDFELSQTHSSFLLKSRFRWILPGRSPFNPRFEVGASPFYMFAHDSFVVHPRWWMEPSFNPGALEIKDDRLHIFPPPPRRSQIFKEWVAVGGYLSLHPPQLSTASQPVFTSV